MTNVVRFEAALREDESLRGEFFASKSLAEAVEAAARRGFVLSESDLAALAGEPSDRPEGALSDEELQTAGGGRSSLFDTLGKIMERYNQSAKNVIQSMRG